MEYSKFNEKKSSTTDDIRTESGKDKVRAVKRQNIGSRSITQTNQDKNLVLQGKASLQEKIKSKWREEGDTPFFTDQEALDIYLKKQIIPDSNLKKYIQDLRGAINKNNDPVQNDAMMQRLLAVFSADFQAAMDVLDRRTMNALFPKMVAYDKKSILLGKFLEAIKHLRKDNEGDFDGNKFSLFLLQYIGKSGDRRNEELLKTCVLSFLKIEDIVSLSDKTEVLSACLGFDFVSDGLTAYLESIKNRINETDEDISFEDEYVVPKFQNRGFSDYGSPVILILQDLFKKAEISDNHCTLMREIFDAAESSNDLKCFLVFVLLARKESQIYGKEAFLRYIQDKNVDINLKKKMIDVVVKSYGMDAFINGFGFVDNKAVRDVVVGGLSMLDQREWYNALVEFLGKSKDANVNGNVCSLIQGIYQVANADASEGFDRKEIERSLSSFLYLWKLNAETKKVLVDLLNKSIENFLIDAEKRKYKTDDFRRHTFYIDCIQKLKLDEAQRSQCQELCIRCIRLFFENNQDETDIDFIDAVDLMCTVSRVDINNEIKKYIADAIIDLTKKIIDTDLIYKFEGAFSFCMCVESLLKNDINFFLPEIKDLMNTFLNKLKDKISDGGLGFHVSRRDRDSEDLLSVFLSAFNSAELFKKANEEFKDFPLWQEMMEGYERIVLFHAFGIPGQKYKHLEGFTTCYEISQLMEITKLYLKNKLSEEDVGQYTNGLALSLAINEFMAATMCNGSSLCDQFNLKIRQGDAVVFPINESLKGGAGHARTFVFFKNIVMLCDANPQSGDEIGQRDGSAVRFYVFESNVQIEEFALAFFNASNFTKKEKISVDFWNNIESENKFKLLGRYKKHSQVVGNCTHASNEMANDVFLIAQGLLEGIDLAKLHLFERQQTLNNYINKFKDTPYFNKELVDDCTKIFEEKEKEFPSKMERKNKQFLQLGEMITEFTKDWKPPA